MYSKLNRIASVLPALALAAAACGGGTSSTNGGGGTAATNGTGGSAGESSLSGIVGGAAGSGASVGDGGSGGACAAVSTEAQLKPVYLAMAFDVSGSMGKLDKPYHDPALKWEPVTLATRSFCEDPGTAGLTASLTFFPIDADEDERCDAGNYGVPDVPMTKLPSTAFGEAIDAITPMSADEWRSGTPTLAVVTGILSTIAPLAASDPASQYALVLISDGYPQGCDDDTIESVAAAVAAVKDTVPTYVIGVSNPPGGPDTVSNLDTIAAAGGTEKAFIIATGDPEQTKTDFKAAIDGISKKQISCELPIPEPPEGQTFDPKKVNVTSTSGGVTTTYFYDESCSAEHTWHYDDPAAPTSIVLCEAACSAIQSDPAAVLQVALGCATMEVPK